jgi:AAA family ATP:ADP antiporter
VPKPKSGLERALSVFTDVRAGEGTSALLLALNIFLILAAYYLLRNVRQTLILTEQAPFGWSGAQLAAYSAAGQALLLLLVVPVYGWLATRIPRIPLITTTTLFFILNLVIFYMAGRAGAREGAVFYIWLGVFNVFVIAQFWAYANDLYTEEQGKRLFPLVGVGMSAGALVGAMVIFPLVGRFQFTPYTLMMLSAVVLLVALGFTFLINRREVGRARPEAVQANEQPLGPEGGFELVLKDRYLTWIAVLIILLNVVNSTGGFLLNYLVESRGAELADEAAQQQFVSLFFGGFDTAVSLLGLLLQLFVTSRAFKYLGVGGSLFILPTIALVNYAVIALIPVLAVIRVGKILENSTDYSIQNTLRHALFLPTSREAKYKAKAAVDTFCTRVGDVLQALLVFGGTTIGLSVAGFAWVNVFLTGVWLLIARLIAMEHRRRTAGDRVRRAAAPTQP